MKTPTIPPPAPPTPTFDQQMADIHTGAIKDDPAVRRAMVAAFRRGYDHGTTDGGDCHPDHCAATFTDLLQRMAADA